jgi:acyl dehydratase
MQQSLTPPYLSTGIVNQLGDHTFTSAEITKFAKNFDPQFFHVDPEAARDSLFGGHCASGWHTISMWMRKQRDFAKSEAANLQKNGHNPPEYGPSPGVRNIKWLKPVFAGDTISYFTEIAGLRPSGSRQGWHLLSQKCGGRNQNGQTVLEFDSTVFIRIS